MEAAQCLKDVRMCALKSIPTDRSWLERFVKAATFKEASADNDRLQRMEDDSPAADDSLFSLSPQQSPRNDPFEDVRTLCE